MTIPSEPRTPRLYHASGDPAFPPMTALALVLASMGSFILVAGILGREVSILAGLFAGQLMFVAVPLVVMRTRKLPRTALGLRRPPARTLVAALLIGSSAWYLNLALVELLPVPEDALHEMQALVEGPPLGLALLVIALVPAVCEEVLFRGVLLRALATRARPAVAITLTALVFAAYHLSLIQLVPTFTLGLVLGLLAWRAGSVVPAVLAHLLNNAIAVLVAREQLPALTDPIAAHPLPALVIAGVVTASGITLALRGPT